MPWRSRRRGGWRRLAVINGVHPGPFQRALIEDAAQQAASSYMHELRAGDAEQQLSADGYGGLMRMVARFGDLAWMTPDKRAAYLQAWSEPGALTAMLNWYRASPLVVPKVGEAVDMAKVPRLDPAQLRVRMPHLLIWGMQDRALLPVSREHAAGVLRPSRGGARDRGRRSLGGASARRGGDRAAEGFPVGPATEAMWRWPMQVAIVTAGGSGMGAAAARRLAKDGYKVAILSSSGKGETLAKELGGIGVTGSNQSNEDLKRLVDQVLAAWGRIDVLVNSAGHGPREQILKITDEQWHAGLDTYLMNVIRPTRLVAPTMVQQKGGAIINISTAWAFEPSPMFPTSAVFRAGLAAFTKVFADQYAADNVRMNNVLPGWIDSLPATEERRSSVPMQRYGTSEEIAATIAFLASAWRCLHHRAEPAGRRRSDPFGLTCRDARMAE